MYKIQQIKTFKLFYHINLKFVISINRSKMQYINTYILFKSINPDKALIKQMGNKFRQYFIN